MLWVLLLVPEQVARPVGVFVSSNVSLIAYYVTISLFCWTLAIEAVVEPEGWLDRSTETRSAEDMSRFERLSSDWLGVFYPAVMFGLGGVLAATMPASIFAPLVAIGLPLVETALATKFETPPLFLLSFVLFLTVSPLLFVSSYVVLLVRRTPYGAARSATRTVADALSAVIETTPGTGSLVDFVRETITGSPRPDHGSRRS